MRQFRITNLLRPLVEYEFCGIIYLMPKRNLILLIVLAIVCLTCYVRANRQEQMLTHVMNLVENQYYYPGDTSPISKDELFHLALGGMLRSLDPYSAYLPPVAYDKMSETLDQRFAGIGAELALAPKTKALTVTALIYGSAAQKAGLKPGDEILTIDGNSTKGKSVSQAVELLRGHPGEVVALSVERAGAEKPIDIEITRSIIATASAVGDRRLMDGQWKYFLPEAKDVAYIRITGFGFQTAKEMSKLIPALLKKGMRGLIIDLRGNPGGTLNSAVELCNLFVPENDVIVSIRSRTAVRDIRAQKGDKFRSFPIAILIDGQTASASEIVSSCLQDSSGKTAPDGSVLNVKIIGSRSFGKGAVQDVFALTPDQGAVKFTVAGYVSPSGRNIHRFPDAKPTDQWGVVPDEGFEVELTAKESNKLQYWRKLRSMSIDLSVDGEDPPFGDPSKYDPCVKRALEFLNSSNLNN